MITAVRRVDSNRERVQKTTPIRLVTKCIAAIVLTLPVLLALGGSFGLTSTSGATRTISWCSATSIRVIEYNSLVGAGHVNSLFWIRNVGDRACSISGYPTVEYDGLTGQPLSVGTSDSPGNDGNFVGGLKRGRVLPISTLKPRGGQASFWVDGLDIQAGSPPPACIDTTEMLVTLPHDSVPTIVRTPRGDGYFWCGAVLVLPVLPGISGSDPSRPLSYYFGVPS
jgi:hypothetical protein